jgi:hypothetical protein
LGKMFNVSKSDLKQADVRKAREEARKYREEHCSQCGEKLSQEEREEGEVCQACLDEEVMELDDDGENDDKNNSYERKAIIVQSRTCARCGKGYLTYIEDTGHVGPCCS